MSRRGSQTFVYDCAPCIAARTSIAGPKEGKGPLGDEFDVVLEDDLLGMKSWELAEGEMVRRAVEMTAQRANLPLDQVQLMISGDLNNQIIASSFAARALGVPFFGQYGACSTFVQSLVLGGALLSGGMAVGGMHRQAVRMVSAGAQARMLEAIEPALTEAEADAARRGRNAQAKHAAPKNADPADYARATGLEALWGYLYLTGQTQRLVDLQNMALSRTEDIWQKRSSR